MNIKLFIAAIAFVAAAKLGLRSLGAALIHTPSHHGFAPCRCDM